ncbi:MAG: pirin family protein [Porticoccaceae bacterium]
MKKSLEIKSAPRPHWVGDGFPVRSLFSYQQEGKQLSPFLLLDYAGPAEFGPANRPRGVGQHPHRGFETVTIVYRGEVAHRDSTGQGGVIGPGDVQWMTAGGGILHEEFHSEAFTRTGGTLEMVQLWVNLPAAAKMTPPGYQAILAKDIPSLPLSGGAGTMRLIAGTYDGETGPAHTFSPLRVADLRLNKNHSIEIALTPGWNSALVVLHGGVRINGDTLAQDAELVMIGGEATLSIAADTDALVLLLSGESLNEPIVGYGPFVMNTEAEISTAMADFNSGRFGQITH